jgi:hypothetical protein
MAMVLDLFGVEPEGKEKEISIERLREWWTYERLPEDWQPTKRVGLVDTFFGSRSIRKHMEFLKRQRQHS